MSLRKFVFTATPVILVILISFMLMLAVTELPVYGRADNPAHDNMVYERYVYESVEESGGTNVIANILLDYRGYDTLLESTVLFSSVIAIMLVWLTRSTSEEEESEEDVF